MPQMEDATPAIPKTCMAGCVVNAGPDFNVVVEDVSVPEPGIGPQPDNEVDYG